jgi:hypothetical protein
MKRFFQNGKLLYFSFPVASDLACLIEKLHQPLNGISETTDDLLVPYIRGLFLAETSLLLRDRTNIVSECHLCKAIVLCYARRVPNGMVQFARSSYFGFEGALDQWLYE